MSDLRYKLMETINHDIPDDIAMFSIQDPLSIDWLSFQFTGNEQKYSLTQNDIDRPDLLSYTFYGTCDYQDIIFLINNIGNLFDLIPKTIILIPDIKDLKNFMLQNRKS